MPPEITQNQPNLSQHNKWMISALITQQPSDQILTTVKAQIPKFRKKKICAFINVIKFTRAHYNQTTRVALKCDIK